MSCIDVTVPPLAPNRPLLLVAAAALIDNEGRVLLAERPADKNMAGLWEFPGGKVKPGETPEAALVRELKEELDIQTSTGCLWPLAFASHGYEDFHLLMPVFGCRVWQGTPRGKEGQKLAWAKKEQFKDYPMPPADIALVQTLWELL
jgi:8-oxo-dGTP diphosphatase